MRVIIYGLTDYTQFIIESGITEYVDTIAFSDKSIKSRNDYIEDTSTGKRFPVVMVDDLHKESYDYIVDTCDAYSDLLEYGVVRSKIIGTREFLNCYVLFRLEKKNNDIEKKRYISFIRKNGFGVFNDSFINKYFDNCNNIIIDFDKEKKLFYTYYCGKKMYMSRHYKNAESVKSYIIGIKSEQDINSPHCYFSDYFGIKDGDVVIDAGVAEGNFALTIIDKVSRIYLVECDEAWLEALKYTFEPYKEKVVFVPKFLSDTSDKNNITIDSISEGNRIDAIKMDIEGAEINALIGAEKTIFSNPDIRIAACSYHKHNDEIIIRSIMEHYGLRTATSKGYMLFIWDENFYKSPEFRRGLVWSVPEGINFKSRKIDISTIDSAKLCDDIKSDELTNYLFIPDFYDDNCGYISIIEKFCISHNNDTAQLIIYLNESGNNNDILYWNIVDVLEQYSEYNIYVQVIDSRVTPLESVIKSSEKYIKSSNRYNEAIEEYFK